MPYNRRKFIGNSILLSGMIGLRNSASSIENNVDPQSKDRLVLLGTQGGPFIRSYKQTPSANVIVHKDIPFVIDTGFGVTFKLIEAGIKLSSIRYIFITHHHSDHNLELGPLLYNAWISGLSETVNVYGPIGLKSLLASWWESNRFDIETRISDEDRPDIRTLVIAHEIAEGVVISNPDVEISAIKNNHPPIDRSYAYRFKLGPRTVVFSGDTAYCTALIPFAAGADYLVHEVMYGPGVDEMLKRRPKNAAKLKASILSHHSSPEDAGKIAAEAKVKNLVLTHFVPPDDKSLTEQFWIDQVKSTFSGNIIVGRDLLALEL